MKKKEFIKAAYYQELELPLMETVEKYFPELVKKYEPFKNGDIVVFKGRSRNTPILVKITNVGKGSCYGFMRGEFGEFDHYSFKSHPSDWKKVDVSVWKERLIEECKKRGIWDTPNINQFPDGYMEGSTYNVYYNSGSDILCGKYGWVYKKGVFATPIETKEDWEISFDSILNEDENLFSMLDKLSFNVGFKKAEKQLGKKIV